MDSVVFPDASVSGVSQNITITPATDVYVYGSKTQLATLEGWFTYCQTALSEVSDAKYQKRINVEMIFPEYAILVFHSKYKTTIRWNSGSDTWRDGTVTPTAPTTSVAVRTYQAFYNNVIALGIEKPNEFTGFDSTNIQSTAKNTLYTFGLYESFFKNWGVTF